MIAVANGCSAGVWSPRPVSPRIRKVPRDRQPQLMLPLAHDRRRVWPSSVGPSRRLLVDHGRVFPHPSLSPAFHIPLWLCLQHCQPLIPLFDHRHGLNERNCETSFRQLVYSCHRPPVYPKFPFANHTVCSTISKVGVRAEFQLFIVASRSPETRASGDAKAKATAAAARLFLFAPSRARPGRTVFLLPLVQRCSLLGSTKWLSCPSPSLRGPPHRSFRRRRCTTLRSTRTTSTTRPARALRARPRTPLQVT